jgi:Fe2+ or Zn2+ uptake regulation protein
MPTASGKKISSKERILRHFDLKSTPLRVIILDTFLKTKKSLSQKEIVRALEKKLGSVDRISIYRNLLAFKKAGFLHQLEDNQYIACQHQCDRHVHILLFCVCCKRYQEISDHSLVKNFVSVIHASHFFSKNSNLTLQGLCKNCRL